MKFESDSSLFRYLIFILACLMSFGTYYSYDMPSVLQKKLEGNMSCGNEPMPSDNETAVPCCHDCLGLSSLQYNYLFASYSWVNAITVILCGVFIDKFGSGVSGIVFSTIVVTGVSIFACGSLPSVRGTSLSFPLLLTGRVILGGSTGGVRIVQDRVIAFWFKHDVSVAFGFLMSFARGSSVINFLVTDKFATLYGLGVTFWTCAGICLLGFFAAIALHRLDRLGIRQLGLEEKCNQQSENTSLCDVKKFPRLFWYVVLTMLFYYSSILPFIADSSKLIQDKYGMTSVMASYISGIIFDCCVVFAPLAGFILDHIGMRGWCVLLITSLTMPVYPMLAFTNIHPAVIFTILGMAYSMSGVSMWPSVAMVVRTCNVGTAFGITTSIISVGIGATNWGVGKILNAADGSSDKLTRWRLVLLLSFVNAIIATVLTVILNVHDTRLGTIVNAKKCKTVKEGGYGSCSSAPPTPECVTARLLANQVVASDEVSRLLANQQLVASNEVFVARKLSLSYKSIV